MVSNETQTSEVLEYLKKYKKISSWTAIEKFGATRLSDIIYRLKKRGYVITAERKNVTTRLGRKTTIVVYTLEEGGANGI